MNYNQHMTPDITNQAAGKISQMLGDQVRKLLERTAPEQESIRQDIRETQPLPSRNRTSEDDRLEFLGYNY